MPVNLIDNILSRLGLIRASQLASAPSAMRATPETDIKAWWDVLESYYLNANLYGELAALAQAAGRSSEEILALRNPTFRTVEYYAATVWPGPLDSALPIKTENENIVQPIQDVWKWSNWAEQKQVAVRRAAWSGSLFLKIETTLDGRPYIHCLRPQSVSSWVCDKRGFVTDIRIDTPRVVNMDGIQATRVKTEIWDMAGVRIYENATGAGGLGDPVEVHPLADFGIDFIPIVYAKFRDVGHWYGAPCISHAIDKIDQVNRIATKAHRLAFGAKSLWALASTANDPTGRPLPPPRLPPPSVKDGEGSDFNVADVDVEAMVRLPSNTSLSSLVPGIDFAGLNESIRDFMAEIEADLPELIYYKLTEQSDVSGRAIRLKMGASIGKTIEVRGSLESALARADMMALTIGVVNGKFTNLGSFDSGALEHGFEERDVLPPDTTAMLNDQILKQALGVPDKQLQTEIGYTEDHFAQWDEWANEGMPTAEDAADKLLTAMTRRGAAPALTAPGTNGASEPETTT